MVHMYYFVKLKGSSEAVMQIQQGGVAVDDAENQLPIDVNDCFEYNNQYDHVKVIRRDGRVLSEAVLSDKPKVKLNLPYSHNKQKYAAPNHILIDDRKDLIEEWESQGGIGILHTSTKNTIECLRKKVIL